MTQTRIALATLTALAAACGSQAGDAYLGEPLLQMRGQVTTSGLTTAQPITPALCFIKPGMGSEVDHAKLPADVRPTFAGTTFFVGDYHAYIVDVEVQGAFPAEFNVNVYTPPPAAALAPLLPGEPPSAFGGVCAVQAEHGAVAEAVTAVGGKSCEVGGSPCHFSNVVMSDSFDRYYYEHAECPNGTPSAEECTVTRGGDLTLLAETGGFEDVVGIASDPELVYLAAPAPAGSYTAWRLGAAEGLSAGYHLRTHEPVGDEAAELEQSDMWTVVIEQALAETNAKHGTSYPQLPDYFDDMAVHHVAPPEVIRSFETIQARLEMETFPMPMRSAVTPDRPGLTLDLEESENWITRLPPLLSPPLIPLPEQ